ncbi:MAG: hypothetical protein L6R41_004049 [Letrouitia leprolyta]|nr:MAG: hypothetical protein L6R41_004049 [Letrouitia leprolyta]
MPLLAIRFKRRFKDGTFDNIRDGSMKYETVQLSAGEYLGPGEISPVAGGVASDPSSNNQGLAPTYQDLNSNRGDAVYGSGNVYQLTPEEQMGPGKISTIGKNPSTNSDSNNNSRDTPSQGLNTIEMPTLQTTVARYTISLLLKSN